MLRFSPTIAVLLLGVMLVAPPLTTMTFGVTAAPASLPGGCHDHGRKVPPATPPSYQCCVTGHQRAIPRAPFSAPTPLSYLCQANQIRQAAPVDVATSN